MTRVGYFVVLDPGNPHRLWPLGREGSVSSPIPGEHLALDADQGKREYRLRHIPTGAAVRLRTERVNSVVPDAIETLLVLGLVDLIQELRERGLLWEEEE